MTSIFGKRSYKVVQHAPAYRPFLTIPQAAGKTFGSKAISDLTLYQGRVYVGYGDYGANNGPTDVVSFDPQTREITTHLKDVPTEAIYPYREFDGWLYGPYVDPRWYYGPGGYVTNEGGQWHTVEVPDMVHTFDIHVDARGVFVCGSRLDEKNTEQAHGVVLFQPRGQTAWERVFLSDDMGDFTRFYSFTVLDGQLRATCVNDKSVASTFTTVDGHNWTPTPTQANDVLSAPVSRSLVIDGWKYAGTDEGTITRQRVST